MSGYFKAAGDIRLSGRMTHTIGSCAEFKVGALVTGNVVHLIRTIRRAPRIRIWARAMQEINR